MGRLKIFSWNVNGLRAVHKKGFLDWFLKERPTILCLQETKVSLDQIPSELREVNDYESFFAEAVKKGYSGVALYTSLKPKAVKGGFGKKKFDEEGRVIQADYGNFVLFNVYFPNGKASKERLKYKMDFYEDFLKCVDSLRKKGRKLIICGDVNTAHKEIDLARPRENEDVSGFLPTERAWMDKLVEHGFIDTFRMFSPKPHQYTWWDYKSGARARNVGWRIDYFFASDNLKKNIKSAYILSDVLGSDHCPIGIDIVF